VATARANQTCSATFAVMGFGNIPATLAVTSSTFTVTDNVGNLVQSGNAMVTSPLTLACTYEITATGTRGGASADAGAGDASGN
jgi:hypothetical protein